MCAKICLQRSAAFQKRGYRAADLDNRTVALGCFAAAAPGEGSADGDSLLKSQALYGVEALQEQAGVAVCDAGVAVCDAGLTVRDAAWRLALASLVVGVVAMASHLIEQPLQ